MTGPRDRSRTWRSLCDPLPPSPRGVVGIAGRQIAPTGREFFVRARTSFRSASVYRSLIPRHPGSPPLHQAVLPPDLNHTWIQLSPEAIDSAHARSKLGGCDERHPRRSTARELGDGIDTPSTGFCPPLPVFFLCSGPSLPPAGNCPCNSAVDCCPSRTGYRTSDIVSANALLAENLPGS